MITWNSLFFHSPNSLMIELVLRMHDYVILFLCSIIIMVLFNLGYLFRFENNNFEFFDNHQLERVWTALPFFVLLFIVVPSIASLYMLDTCIFCGLSVSIMGHQWYWSYIYKDFKDLTIDSYMVSSNETSLRLVDVDNRLVVPTSLPVRFIVRSADVIHSWTVPSFGVKMDAVPGRINQFCFSSKRRGIFFGQCSEICGANHRFIPIVLESVPFNRFVKLFF